MLAEIGTHLQAQVETDGIIPNSVHGILLAFLAQVPQIQRGLSGPPSLLCGFHLDSDVQAWHLACLMRPTLQGRLRCWPRSSCCTRHTAPLLGGCHQEDSLHRAQWPGSAQTCQIHQLNQLDGSARFSIGHMQQIVGASAECVHPCQYMMLGNMVYLTACQGVHSLV